MKIDRVNKISSFFFGFHKQTSQLVHKVHNLLILLLCSNNCIYILKSMSTLIYILVVQMMNYVVEVRECIEKKRISHITIQISNNNSHSSCKKNCKSQQCLGSYETYSVYINLPVIDDKTMKTNDEILVFDIS